MEASVSKRSGRAALIATPSGPAAPNIIIALIPKNNTTVNVLTSGRSGSAPTHDG